jgi:hypothetical protein
MKIKKESLNYLIPALVLILFFGFILYKGGSLSSASSAIGGYKYEGYFIGGSPGESLDIRLVRWHKHKGYERVVFDVYEYNGVLTNNNYTRAKVTGEYEIGREGESSDIDGELRGYIAFSASIPSFNGSNVIRRLEVFPDKDSYLFTFTLKKRAAYKVFTLKNPTRIVIDIAD